MLPTENPGIALWVPYGFWIIWISVFNANDLTSLKASTDSQELAAT